MSKNKLIGIIGACITVVIVVIVIVTRSPAPTHTPSPIGTYTLSVSVSPSGAGSVSPSGGEYESGVQVTLTASPASGYTFDHWSGSASGTASTITITMDSDKDIAAHFKLEVAPELVDISPNELIETIYGNDLTSLQREELWIGYKGKRVRWTGKLTELWSVGGYPGFGFLGAGTDWVVYWLEEESIIASFDAGYIETSTGTWKTDIEIHVAFNEESKPSLLSLSKGSVVTFEGTISYPIWLSGGELEYSLVVGLRLADGTIVGHA